MKVMKLSLFLTGMLLAVGRASPGNAGEHWGIITDFTNSALERATLEISAEALVNVTFEVFGTPGGIASGSLAPETLFLSSESTALPNLFAASGGGTALVRATTVAQVDSSVVLRQRSGLSRILLHLPPSEQSLGVRFEFPISNIGQGAFLILGNPNPSAVEIDVSFGPPTAPPNRVRIDPERVVSVPLATPNTRVAASVVGPAQVLAMLAIDAGRIEETILVPLD
jgi:hypothetical protein